MLRILDILNQTESTLIHEFSDGSGSVLFNKESGAVIGVRCCKEDLLSGNNVDVSLLNQLKKQGFLEVQSSLEDN